MWSTIQIVLFLAVGKAGKFIYISLNYSDNVKETSPEIPKEPVTFSKWIANSGPYDSTVLPKESTKTDWEVELGIIIANKANISLNQMLYLMLLDIV